MNMKKTKEKQEKQEKYFEIPQCESPDNSKSKTLLANELIMIERFNSDQLNSKQ